MAFLDPAAFPFTAALAGAWEAIRDEALALPHDAYDPWVQRAMYGDGWRVFGLVVRGEPIAASCERCPQTARAVQSVPGLTLAGFSRLAPGAHIKPHEGWGRSVHRLHLGLVVPDGCALRVGNETRPWREGACLIFDDTVEHEAWNRSEGTRTVLLLDFLRPGIDRDDDPAPPEVERYLRQRFG